ncbi:peroxiredoxin family protein [Lacinutrix salivirga]
MKVIKTLTIIAFLQISLCNAQDYKFVPNNQHLLTQEQLKTINLVITPDILLFSERGKLLPMSKLELMTNPDYRPLFYADANGTIKTVVFQKKSNHPILIEKNPEAEFTVGEKALDFIVKDINGKNIKLSELRGKVVVLNFWFTKCPPCIVEIPELNALKAEFEGQDVVFLAITFNKKENVKQFLKTKEFNYTMGVNANDAISTYGVQSYPTNMVINQNGEIVLKEIGYRTNIKNVLRESIKSLLQ